MARPYLLPVGTAAAAIATFIVDTITGFEIAVPVLYVPVVLMAARFLQPRGVLLVALGCMALAAVSHVLTRHGPLWTPALVNLLMGLSAIAIATYLALIHQSTERALKEQAGLLDVTHDTIFVRNMNDVITYWNRGAEALYGWSKEEALGKVSHHLLQTKFPAPLDRINASMLEAGRWEGELVHSKRDGTQVTVASRWSLQRDEGGQLAGILETNNDITERKRVEAQLRQSEERYRNIFQTAGVSIWEEDFSQVKRAIDHLKTQGVRDFRWYLAEHPEFIRQAVSMVKVVDVNDASIKLFEAENKDELLAALQQVFTAETHEVFAGELIAIAEGRSSFESETVLQTLRQSKLSVLFTVAFSPERANLDSVLVSIMDITAARRAEEELQQAKMELAHMSRVTTLGELAASIAHEVNQPIAGVVTNAGAALRWLDTRPPDLQEVRQALDDIVTDGNRAGEIVNRIRALVKKVPPRRDALDINGIILEVIALTRSELHRNGVTLQTELASDLPLVRGDRIQLQQVVLNLILNAIEAMTGIGQGRRHLLVGTDRDGADGILVTVGDSGPGLDPEKVDQLFRAFYTTKPGGMGMGLSICRSIIEAHEGRIWATSNVDAGATFQFTLPSHREAAS